MSIDEIFYNENKLNIWSTRKPNRHVPQGDFGNTYIPVDTTLVGEGHSPLEDNVMTRTNILILISQVVMFS